MVESTKVNWHSMNADQIIQHLHTRFDGLTDREANERLGVYGQNKIKEEKERSSAAIFVKQIREPLIIILLVAITISAFVGDFVDAIIIIAIVILSALVGFIQEFKSEKAIDALKKMTAATCRVIRNSKESLIEVTKLVPGDMILLSAGDRVPADAYLIEAHNLKVDEAPLTGESSQVEKSVAVLSENTSNPDRKNIVYTVTTITHGRGRALVFSTGMETELGRVAGAVQTIDFQKTPFELKIRHAAKLISKIMLVVIGIVSLIAFIR